MRWLTTIRLKARCFCTLLALLFPIVVGAQPESHLCTAIRYRRWAEAARLVENGAADKQAEAQAALGMLAGRWWGDQEDYALRWKLLNLLLKRGADPFSVAPVIHQPMQKVQ